MPQLPEQIRPFAAAVAKYHFWILAALVPLVLLPLLFLGIGKVDKEIGSRKQEIDGRVSALGSIKGISPHPNERWTEAFEAQTQKIREETLAEWTRFWKAQEPVRDWPKRLGDDFIKAVNGLKPGGALNRALLLRYQNTVAELVRELPKRMGADDLMVEGAGPMAMGGDGVPGARGPGGPFGGEFGPRPGLGGEFGPRPGLGGPAGIATSGSMAVVQWSQADQKRLLDSFTFDSPAKRCGKDVISTAQVKLAQEELWVYGLLCDTIRTINQGAEGPLDAPIGTVMELAVGYPAAEDQVGGQGTGRILMPMAPAGMLGGEGMPSPEMMGMPGEGGAMPGAGRPANPRFAGGTGPAAGLGGPVGGEGMVDPAAAAPASPEEQLREWIYTDFTGKPLSAAEVGSLPEAKLVHLMPFVLRVSMDQRKLDALLVELASNPVPIDVRQVRINPSSQSGGPAGGRGGEFAPAPSYSSPDGLGGAPARPHDVVVELRGTVGLAPPPDPGVLGGTNQATAGGGA